MGFESLGLRGFVRMDFGKFWFGWVVCFGRKCGFGCLGFGFSVVVVWFRL